MLNFIEPKPTMNIYAKEGDKVILAYPDNGYSMAKERLLKHLVVGETYTVDFTIVHQSSTEVFLKEVPDQSFNSVNFVDAEEEQ